MKIVVCGLVGALVVILTGPAAFARLGHGYSAVFAIDTVTAVDGGFGGGDDRPSESAPPLRSVLSGIFPNPFNPRATIEFELAAAGVVELAVFDLRGRLVRVVEQGSRSAGRHQAEWDGLDRDGRAVPAGAYCCRLLTADGVQTRKLALAR
jgi:hypothetical protein